MKIFYKQSIIEMLDSLFDQHKQLYYCTDMNEQLTKCQQIAITIGTTIEKYECHDKIIVLLENYCENLYQISIKNKNEDELKSIIFNLDRQITEIKIRAEKCIKEELYEIVFMPYNSTMWDAMESIYFEVIKDRRFNVVVLPIPYYIFDKNNKCIENQYDGGKFPDYIKITKYYDYDITEKKPDVIFIHNPYDEYNHVTRVNSNFYSSELIKYTQKLVYIPYYISDELTMDYMCNMPGVKNAWRVFVQSEKIKNQYDKWNNSSRIIAIGSPKIDKLLKINNSKDNIKKDWLDVVNGKTVFLFNTHLNNIINESTALINKIKFIISIFKEKDEIALLWRPHPLSIETAKSLSPSILNDYLNVIQEFKLLRNGIYDDTADLYTSISLSNAYIGDEYSSIVKLYGITGKPMLFLNELYGFDDNKPKCIRTISPAVVGDKLYMFSWEYNALFEFDIKTGDNIFICSFPSENIRQQNLYSEAVVSGDKIYYIPCAAKKIAVYNTAIQSLSHIEINHHKFDDYNVVVHKYRLYLIPIYYSNEMYSIDIDNNSIELIKTNYDLTIKNFKEFGRIPLFYGKIVIGNKIWRACRIGNFLQVFDMETLKFDYYEVTCNVKSFRDITYDGKDFWILPNSNDNIIRWNDKTRDVQIINIYSTNENKSTNYLQYNEICYCNGGVWVIPFTADEILKINIETKEVSKISCDNLKGFERDYANSKVFNDYIIEQEKLLLFPYQSNSIVCIDTESFDASTVVTKIDHEGKEIEWINKIVGKYKNLNSQDNMSSYTYDEKICSISNFIFIVKNNIDIYQKERSEFYSKNIKNADGSCGVNIWKYILDKLKRLE